MDFNSKLWCYYTVISCFIFINETTRGQRHGGYKKSSVGCYDKHVVQLRCIGPYVIYIEKVVYGQMSLSAICAEDCCESSYGCVLSLDRLSMNTHHSALIDVIDKCEGKSSCTVMYNEEITTKHCTGNMDYFVVHYGCPLPVRTSTSSYNSTSSGRVDTYGNSSSREYSSSVVSRTSTSNPSSHDILTPSRPLDVINITDTTLKSENNNLKGIHRSDKYVASNSNNLSSNTNNTDVDIKNNVSQSSSSPTANTDANDANGIHNNSSITSGNTRGIVNKSLSDASASVVSPEFDEDLGLLFGQTNVLILAGIVTGLLVIISITVAVTCSALSKRKQRPDKARDSYRRRSQVPANYIRPLAQDTKYNVYT